MFQVRIHGRGGQGVVTAAELLSVAAFREDRHAQAFPSFGSERTGAPVVAFCRIDDRPIRLREPILAPDALIIQDPTLLHQVDVFGGLEPDGYILINTTRTFDELGLAEFVGRFDPDASLHGARDRNRPAPRRPAAAQRGAAGRLRGADGPHLAGIRGGGDYREIPAEGGRRQCRGGDRGLRVRAAAGAEGDRRC